MYRSDLPSPAFGITKAFEMYLHHCTLRHAPHRISIRCARKYLVHKDGWTCSDPVLLALP